MRLRILKCLPPRELNNFVVHPIYGVENICKFNRAWLEYFTEHKAGLVITYEQLHGNMRECIVEVFQFLGLSVNNVDTIVESCRFENMERAAQTGANRLKLEQQDPNDPDSAKLRRGKVKGYVDYLDGETIERCRQIAASHGFSI